VNRFDAILFDFDGVLAESADIKTRAFMSIYNSYGPTVVNAVIAHHKDNEGISRVDKIRHCHHEILGIALDPEALDDVAQRYSEMVEDAVVAADWVPGARDFLDSFRDRLPMSIISGTPQEELRRITAKRGMDHYFVSVRGSPPRKEPIIDELVSAGGWSADRVLFVGDAMTDYRAAHTTGLHFIGRVVTGRPSPFPDGTPTIPDLIHLADCL